MTRKTNKRNLIVTACLILALCISTFAQAQDKKETQQQRDKRMDWWREAKFGLFIHWGVYSVFGGDYENKVESKNDYIGPWILRNNRYPIAMYKEYSKQFNPVKYDPEAWVLMAKDAGMKYIVITTKHHDGFALFDSKVSNWDVVDASPYGKDLLKPLAEACKKHGIKLGFYYSQSNDWVHPGGRKPGGDWDDAHKGDMKEYVRNIAVPQVKELLTNYGDVAVMWWDTPSSIPQESCDELYALMKLQPNIIMNSRLGGGYKGDFKTSEQKISSTSINDWESCMTMNKGWGYNKNDDQWKTSEALIQNLVDIASRGGNYLLNVGPTAQGTIPDESIQRLKDIGNWMKANSDSIYGTTASPFEEPLEWGKCTKKVKDGKTVLYLHVLEWPEPEQGDLTVPGLMSKVKKAYLLASNETLKTSNDEQGVLIEVPEFAPDEIDTVIALEIEGDLKIEKIE